MSVRFLKLPTGPSDQELDAWFSPGRFAALLALLILVMFPDVLLGGRTFILRDFGLFGYPLAQYFRDSFWRGEIPLWNPLSNCGLPFLAQWNTLVLYPGSLFYLLLPLEWSLGVFNLLAYRGAESSAFALGLAALAGLLSLGGALALARSPLAPAAAAGLASLVGLALAPACSAEAVALPLVLLALAVVESAAPVAPEAATVG